MSNIVGVKFRKPGKIYFFGLYIVHINQQDLQHKNKKNCE